MSLSSTAWTSTSYCFQSSGFVKMTASDEVNIGSMNLRSTQGVLLMIGCRLGFLSALRTYGRCLGPDYWGELEQRIPNYVTRSDAVSAFDKHLWKL